MFSNAKLFVITKESSLEAWFPFEHNPISAYSKYSDEMLEITNQ